MWTVSNHCYSCTIQVKIKTDLPQQILIEVIKEKMESRQIKGTKTVSVISGNNKNKIRNTKNRTDRK
jgi:hypothetical protein